MAKTSTSKKRSTTSSGKTARSRASKKSETKQNAPPAGEQTPPDTHATSSLQSPADRGPAGAQGISKDDAKEAAERVKGSTSDAATRSEDVTASEVPPDPTAMAKPSDGGPEAYPFPPQGDVDVATVTGKTKGKTAEQEYLPPIPVGAWVRLGEHEDVPERFVGHLAYVTDSPTILCNCDYAPKTHEHQAPDALLTVKTRDEADATLVLPVEAFAEWSLDGRHGLAPIG